MALKGIVLVTIDSLRSDVVKECDCKNITRLARDGIVFDNHISTAPYTALSMYSLMTSKYPICTTYYNEPCPLTGSVVTLAEALRGIGYKTFALQDSNPFLSKYHGYSRGFDVFVEYSGSSMGRLAEVVARIIDRMVDKEKSSFLKYYLLSIPKPVRGARMIVRALLGLLEQTIDVDSRFFAWTHLMDTHGPHTGKGTCNLNRFRYAVRRIAHYGKSLCNHPSDVKIVKALYLEEVHLVDEAIGDLIEWLKDNGLYDSVALLVTADHGEEFCDHGGYGHKAKLYEELVKVPLIIKLPGSRLAGSVYRHTTSHIDILPTMLSLAGEDKDRRKHSVYGKPLLEDLSRPKHRPGVISIAYSKDYHLMSMRTDRYKLICYFNPASAYPARVELYDLTNDPSENNNIVNDVEKDIVTELMGPLIALRKSILLKKRLAERVKGVSRRFPGRSHVLK